MKKLFLALLLLVFPFYVFAVGIITLDPMEHEGTTLSIDRGAAMVYSLKRRNVQSHKRWDANTPGLAPWCS